MTSGSPRTDLDAVHRWCGLAARAAAAKKAEGTVVFDIGEVLAITDAFVITSAPNRRLVATIVEEVEAKLKEAGGPSPLAVEGMREAQWVLMDYGEFVVHVFLDDVRAYYDLERLWADVPRWEWDDGRERAASSR